MTDARMPPVSAEIPPELDRWNWGAFLLNWIWGIGNETFIALLTLVPGLGIIMMFVLGFKGSRWAWRNGRWDSIEHFKRVQRRWAIWGVVVWLGAIVLFGALFGGVFYALKNSDAYQLAVERIQTSSEVARLLGTPIATGVPSGSIKTSSATGEAKLNFPVSGPRAAGQISLEAVKNGGVWSLKKLMLKLDDRDEAIDLLGGSRVEIGNPDRRLTALPSREVPNFASRFASYFALA